MSDPNIYEAALKSVASSLHREIADQKVERYLVASESANSHVQRYRSESRFYELQNAAGEFVGGGKLFSPFGELTSRERDIAIAAALYVVFGRVRD